MWQLKSEAAKVLYFENQLAVKSKAQPLSEKKLLSIRSEFLSFISNDLQSFSFSGLQSWTFCCSEWVPQTYQDKLLKIIELGNISRADLTLHFILIFAGKIFETPNRNDTLWKMLHQLLVSSRDVQVEKKLWETTEEYLISDLVARMDEALGSEYFAGRDGCREILHRMIRHYTDSKKKSPWKELENYRKDGSEFSVDDTEVNIVVDDLPDLMHLKKTRNRTLKKHN